MANTASSSPDSSGATDSVAESWRARDRQAVSGVYSRYTDLVIQDGEGSFLIDVDGRRYLDFGCGIAVTALGYRHPDVTRAIHRQVDGYWHTSVVTQHVRLTEAAEKVASICPDPLDRVFFANSGAEVVEGALKLARQATHRPGIVAFIGGFHGRTFGALSVTTSKVHYREHYSPLLPGVHTTPYPYCFRNCGHGPDEPCPVAMGAELEKLFKHVVPADEVAAILVEPIQGEGGYIVPPPGFLATLRQICDRHGIVLIFDEVQTGVGHTGRWLASDHEGVVPDVVTLAKALGSGLPIGAIVARHDLMDKWPAGTHGSTFGGNAIACAAAIATIEVIQRDGLLQRATEIGDKIMSRAHAWQQRVGGPADVRGRGAMVGLEFMDSAGLPDAERVDAIRAACLQSGLLVLGCGIDDNVIRLIPPLTLSDSEVEQGLQILEQAVLQGGTSA
ncbi:MAG: aspartate aminotransferase family protein [Candidatus Dormibacteria bacterium]